MTSPLTVVGSEQQVGVPLAWSTRDGVIETRHTGHMVGVVDDTVVGSAGVPGLVNPMRSTGKPFMVQPLLDHVEVTDVEVALFSSSHNGEPWHTKQLRASLRARGLSEAWLILGGHEPFVPDLPFDPPLRAAKLVAPLQNNCSGKHVGLMVLAQALGQDPATYAERDGAALRCVREHMTSLAASVGDEIRAVTDGCGIPTYVTGLETIARLYARLAANDAAPAMARVRRSLLAHPYAVGGARRANTAILKAGLVAKEGFQGLFVLAFETAGVGRAVALKVDSGDDVVAEAIVLRLAQAILGDETLGQNVYPGVDLHDQVGHHTGRICLDEERLLTLVSELVRAPERY